jgi:hypothetical protein
LEEQARSVRTVPELKAFMTTLGRHPDEIGYRHDREQRRGSGELLLERLADGTWEAAVYEREKVFSHRRFLTEQEAVRTLALEKLESYRRTPKSTITPEELAEIDRAGEAQLAYFTERARRARKRRGGR